MANTLTDPDQDNKRDVYNQDDPLAGKNVDNELAGIEQTTKDQEALLGIEKASDSASDLEDNFYQPEEASDKEQLSSETKLLKGEGGSSSESPSSDEDESLFRKEDSGAGIVGRVKKNRKKIALIGGGSGGAVGIIMAILIAIQPLKLDFVLANITQQVAQVPE